MTRRLFCVLGATGMALVLFAACSSSTQSRSPSPTPTSGNEVHYATQREWAEALNECMVNKGVDPSSSSDKVDAETFEQYQASCLEEVGPAPARSQADLVDPVVLAFAQCMRDAGYDFPDPDPDASAQQGFDSSLYDPADIERCNTESQNVLSTP